MTKLPDTPTPRNGAVGTSIIFSSFAGTHARYVLRSNVELIDQDHGDIDMALPQEASTANSAPAVLSLGGPRNV